MFSLMLYQPLSGIGDLNPTSTLDLSPDATSIRWSTALPGGFADLEIGLERGLSYGSSEFTDVAAPIDIVPFAHVQLWYGSFLCFEGRIMRIVRPGGVARGFSAIGYGLSALTDDFYQSISPQLTTAGAILRDIFSTRAPLIKVGPGVQDPGTAHAPNEFDGMTPADVLNQLLSEGGAQQTVWDFTVYEGRVANFFPRTYPFTPDYAIPLDSRVSWSEDYTQLFGQVAIRFSDLVGTGTLTTPRVTDPSFKERFGLVRAAIIDGGKLRDSTAVNFANNYLNTTTNQPAFSAQVTRSQLQGLATPGGIDMPPWLARAGQWLQVGAQPALPIIHTEYDAMSQTLTLEAGNPAPTGATMVRGLRKIGEHVRRGTNPNTGARAA
jgi:hypothetical protein